MLWLLQYQGGLWRLNRRDGFKADTEGAPGRVPPLLLLVFVVGVVVGGTVDVSYLIIWR